MSNLSKQNIVSRRDDEEESQTAQLQVRDSDLVDAKLSYDAEQHGLCLYAIIINSFSHDIKTQEKAKSVPKPILVKGRGKGRRNCGIG